MNCVLDFTNPADVSWGTVVVATNGTSYFTGHYKELIDRKIDIITCGNVMTYLRSRASKLCLHCASEACMLQQVNRNTFIHLFRLVHFQLLCILKV